MTPSSAPSRKLVVHFVRFGPYHLARLRIAASLLAPHGWQLIGLETAALDRTYAWRYERTETSFERYTVFPYAAAEALPALQLRRGISLALSRLSPQAVAIAGWATPDARSALSWCRRHRSRPILMSDTRAADGNRVWWKEAVKRRLLRRFDSALVAGASHCDYLVNLGFPRNRVTTGFDVVDNHYFRNTAQEFRKSTQPCARPFLLASNRFLPRKNLLRLLEAFSIARSKGCSWDLCLLGDGPERLLLERHVAALGMSLLECAPWDQAHSKSAGPGLFFPGFRQIDELPRFYACASAFIHPALCEPWGLVINEAMAAGLPILSSANVGAAETLVHEARNGFCFDPLNVSMMADAIFRLSSLPASQLAAMGDASTALVEECCPITAFGDGLQQLLSLPPR